MTDNFPETTTAEVDFASLPWDDAIAQLLERLSGVQGELLGLLDQKRRFLVDADLAGLAEMEPREKQLIAQLEECQTLRATLLERAQTEGLPSDSIRAIASSLPAAAKSPLNAQIVEAQARSRLLHHHSLTNWVLVQRTLIHLSQMLEIIATGGRMQPTYEQGRKTAVSGSLMDHAA